VLDDQVSILGRGSDRISFSLRHRVQTGSGAHPTSCPVGTWSSFPGVKQPEREADHPPSSIAEVKNSWNYISIPQYVVMEWCLLSTEVTLHYFTLLFSICFHDSV